MKIDFEITQRKFRIETISNTQVQLSELKTVQDENSKNFGKEATSFIGYLSDECAALEKLNQVIPLTAPLVETFEQLKNVKDEVKKSILEIKDIYKL